MYNLFHWVSTQEGLDESLPKIEGQIPSWLIVANDLI
jgi:hypothetical protein